MLTDYWHASAYLTDLLEDAPGEGDAEEEARFVAGFVRRVQERGSEGHSESPASMIGGGSVGESSGGVVEVHAPGGHEKLCAGDGIGDA